MAAKQEAADVPVAPVPPLPQAVLPLPSWTDPAAVTSYLTTAIGIIFAVITGIHPGYTEPVLIQSLLPSVGLVIAGAAQIFNIVTHRTSTAKIAVAALQNPGTTNVTLK